MEDNTHIRNIIICAYFSFTSLSTVGFGDYYPKSDVERFVNAFMLFMGIICFSYINGVLSENMEEFGNLTADLDEGDQLTRFFGLIYHYNEKSPMDLDLKNRIELYFKYKWQKDLKIAIDSDE